jgi:hypothetical protein
MADLPLITALSGILTVPCVIALTQSGDKPTKVFAGVCAAIGLWLGLYPYVDFFRDLTTGTLLDVLAILALVLAIIIAIRLKHQILGTLIITAGSLIALRALGVVGS